ncbi:MAG: phosphatidylglycerophosphatase A [Alphaproteobacteria bacterium]|jgi:phosphatidylglycerophosphatase A
MKTLQYYNIHFLISTFFGLGKTPKIPGTIGSIAAFPVAYYIFSLAIAAHHTLFLESEVIFFCIIFSLISTLIIFVIGTYSADRYSKLTEINDPKEVVIDEVVGQMLTIFLTIPFSFMFLSNSVPIDLLVIISLLVSFILFRIFDILKPWPINWIDKKIKGGFGIMLDDVMAAIFAIVVYDAVLIYIIDYFTTK